MRAADLGTKSTDTDLVTAADRAVERLIVGAAARRAGRRPDPRRGVRRRPADGTGPAAGVRWVVDPIDGTVNYVYGLPQYAVSIAAEVDGVSVAGVVRNAATGEEWTAVRGRRRLAGRGTRLTGSAGDRAGPVPWWPPASATTPPGGRTRPGCWRGCCRWCATSGGSARPSLDLCLAAEGRVDAYFEKGLNAWDHAAGGLIAAEAGLLVTGLRGAAARSGDGARRPAGPARAPARPAGRAGRRRRPLTAASASHAAQVPRGASGLPMAAIDWFTSVVVASCWNLVPSDDVDLGALALDVEVHLGLVDEEVGADQLRRRRPPAGRR